MKIRMKATRFATPHGSTEEFVEGNVYDMVEPREVAIARGFIAFKWAEEVEDPKPEKKPDHGAKKV